MNHGKTALPSVRSPRGRWGDSRVVGVSMLPVEQGPMCGTWTDQLVLAQAGRSQEEGLLLPRRPPQRCWEPATPGILPPGCDGRVSNLGGSGHCPGRLPRRGPPRVEQKFGILGSPGTSLVVQRLDSKLPMQRAGD
ncbi:hypothetical protein CapIbe_017855 [Capra ibex]